MKRYKLLLIVLLIVGCEETTAPEIVDCAGVAGGSAANDDCGLCTGGTTGLEVNYLKDCAGTCAGDAVEDIDGNCYATVRLGTQLWMAENLKVTKYRDGTAIPTGYSDSDWTNLTTGAYAVYDNNSSNADTYGNLYNWYVVENQQVCMDGWHVPSDEEFMELEMFLGMSEEEANIEGWRVINEGSKLAGNADLWNNGDLENNSEFGTSGFTALPAGFRVYTNGDYHDMGNWTYFWLSSETPGVYAWYRILYYNFSSASRYFGFKQFGFSIRCVKD